MKKMNCNNDFAKKAYEQPMMKVAEIDNCDIICQSPQGRSNELYEDGNTDGWFNN